MKEYLNQIVYNEIISPEDWKNKYRKKVLKNLNVNKYKTSLVFLKELFTKLNGGTFRRTIVFDYVSKSRVRLNQKDNELMQVLKDAGYDVSVEAYKAGYVSKNGKSVLIKQVIDSTKSRKLDGMKKQYETTKDDRILKQIQFTEKLQTLTDADLNRLNLPKPGNKKKIVFTMDARAIASQSTRVGWTSCMNLEGGMYSDKVGAGISLGVFIVWLAKIGDEKELKGPTARLLCKPYVGKATKQVIWKPDKVYGTPPGRFYDTVETILKKYIKPKGDTYALNKAKHDDDINDGGGFYLDILRDKYEIMSLSDEKLIDKFHEFEHMKFEGLPMAFKEQIFSKSLYFKTPEIIKSIPIAPRVMLKWLGKEREWQYCKDMMHFVYIKHKLMV